MQTRRWRRLVMAALLSSVLLSLGASHVLALQVGDKAPDFCLPATTGGSDKTRRLRGEEAGGAVLLHCRFHLGLNAGSAGLST